SILGDTLYGGESFGRLCLHAEQLSFCHPASGKECSFRVEPKFFEPAAFTLRCLVIDPKATSAFRLIHGASDCASFYLEKWGDYALIQSDAELGSREIEIIRDYSSSQGFRSVYHKKLNRHVARTSQQEAAPQLMFGTAAPPTFNIHENDVEFELSF